MRGSIVYVGLMQHHLIYPKAMVLYYKNAQLRGDCKLWNHIAMNQTLALKRLVRAQSFAEW